MPILLAFIQANYKVLLIGLALVALYMYGHHNGAESVQAKWDRAIAEAQLKAIETERMGIITSNEVENDLQKRFASIGVIYDGELNKLQSPGGDMPEATRSSGAGNAAACGAGLRAESKREILRLAHLADIQTAQLVSCQQWITRQSALYR